MPFFTQHPKRKLAAIYGGGVLGALVRVGLAQAFPHAASSWPWPTFAVNMIGALLIGYFFASFRDHPPDRLHHPFFATGICGTLTTFSTVQLELYAMVDGGHLALAALYCGVTIALGFSAVRAGMAIERLSLREARA
ncbi:MAG TPA: CrcB family protein [Solirubrobacterales bacterium]|nr:CrcB family protein [Solirubrobacterales bacterium]